MAGGMHEDLAIVGTIDPDANATGELLTDAIDMSKFEEVTFYVMAGELGAAATLAFKVTESATSGGTYTDITGRAITTLVKATDDDKQAIVRVRKGHLGDGKQFIKGSLTTGVATSDGAVLALAGRANYSPASGDDLASVAQIVG